MAQPFCNSEVKVGTVVVALRNMYFCDNTMHKAGERIVVSEETLAYYRMFTNDHTYSICEEKSNARVGIETKEVNA